MSNPTVTFEIPNGDKPVKWALQTPETARSNILAYRLAGLEGTADLAEISSLVQQALTIAGHEGKYILDAVPEMTVRNEYGRTAQLGWRVKTEGADGLLEARLTLSHPSGWSVDVLGQSITHPLAFDLSQALALQVVQETNASKLPPVESAFTPAPHIALTETGEPAVLPSEAPPVGSLLSQAEKEAIDLADAKARATAAGYTVDE